jgi:hypothetical protein
MIQQLDRENLGESPARRELDMNPGFFVLHFGAQCPWYQWVIEQATQASAEVGGSVDVIDVTDDFAVAHKYRLFSPFMTVINDAIRVPAPIAAKQLVALTRNRPAIQPAANGSWGSQKRPERIERLQVDNLRDICPLCLTLDDEERQASCSAKQHWLAQLATPGEALGLVAYEGGQAVGAVEYLPASRIPYPVRGKEPDKAFLTCLYSTPHSATTDGFDCRGYLLEELVRYLEGRYQAVQVIAGRRTAYPNGPSGLFAAYGFRELEPLDEVDWVTGHDEWVLMERTIGT